MSRWLSAVGPLPNILAGVVNFRRPLSEIAVFCRIKTISLCLQTREASIYVMCNTTTLVNQTTLVGQLINQNPTTAA